MKKIFTAVILLFALSKIAFAQNLFYSNNAFISFFSEARLENIEAKSNNGTTVINLTDRGIAFKIPIRSFIFHNGLMQEHFNENYMESDKYPYATFQGKILEDIDLTKEGEYKVKAKGKMSIHGVTKEVSIPGVILVKGNKIQITSSFIVSVSDYKIDIPNDKLTNISQDISVKIEAIYEPKK